MTTDVTTMTNFEKWNYYMKDVESPDVYVTMGYYFMIAAALQRRVWFPFKTLNCYPNMYVIFTGPPSIGKGRVITQVSRLIKYWSRPKKEETQLDTADTINVTNDEIDNKLKVTPQLFSTLPDSTSLRALTNHMAKSFFAVNQILEDGTKKIYGHCSSAFILEELSDLFREQKETRDISRFLTRAWDCGDFQHETYANGRDLIRKMCVSMIAGTSPKFMK